MPNKKNSRYLYIMLYSNSKDTTLIINGLTQKCQTICKNKSYTVYCPNKSCRYFYNWVNLKSEATNSKLLQLIDRYIKQTNSVLLYGALNDEQSHNIEVSKIIPNIRINTNKNSIIDVTTMIEETSLIISNNNSCNDLDSIAQIILSYADYVFSVIDNKPQVKNLNTILDIYENALNVCHNFPQNNFVKMLEGMTTEITSNPIDENQIDEYILFCKRFLKLFPNDIKILLDLQYFSIISIKCKPMMTSDIKKIAKELLAISNITLPNDPDGTVLELNKAYLLLLAEDFDYAIKIYNNTPSLPPKIYSFFIDTKDSPSLGVYSKYAFIINYYHKTSSPNHNTAIMFAQKLTEEYKYESNSELYKSFKKFIKRKKQNPRK